MISRMCRPIFASALTVALAVSGTAYAQSTIGAPDASSRDAAKRDAAKQKIAREHSGLTIEKLRQDLQTAGFTDVKVLADSFFIQAKTKDGNPVVMTLGPDGLSALEMSNWGGPGQVSPTAENGSPTAGGAAQSAGIVRPSLVAGEDAAQLKSDKASLERQIKRLDADQATLKSDTTSGRMSAESKDADKVYNDRKAVQGENKDIVTDKAGSLQKKQDMAALQRALKRLDADEATLKSDTASEKMSAESKDANKAYNDTQAVQGEKSAIAADKAKLKADQ